MHTPGDASPTPGGKWAGVLFALTLLAFVLESQLTQVRLRYVLSLDMNGLTLILCSMSKRILGSGSPILYCESSVHQLKAKLTKLRQIYRTFRLRDNVSSTLPIPHGVLESLSPGYIQRPP